MVESENRRKGKEIGRCSVGFIYAGGGFYGKSTFKSGKDGAKMKERRVITVSEHNQATSVTRLPVFGKNRRKAV